MVPRTPELARSHLSVASITHRYPSWCVSIILPGLTYASAGTQRSASIPGHVSPVP